MRNLLKYSGWYSENIAKKIIYLSAPVLVVLSLLDLTYLFGAESIINTFLSVLALFIANAVLLLFHAVLCKVLLRKMIAEETAKGRPIESLRGFGIIKRELNKNIMIAFWVALVALIASSLYFALLFYLREEFLAITAASFTLLSFGLALFIKSLRINIYDIAGLKDYYQPYLHELYLDRFVSDLFETNLDPLSLLKWDDYINQFGKAVKEEYAKRVKETDPEENPVRVALEKYLYLVYLHYIGALTKDDVVEESKEFATPSDFWDPIKGAKIDGEWLFDLSTLKDIFALVNKNTGNPLKIIDRLQVEIMERISVMASKDLYFDVAATTSISESEYANIILFIFNNREAARKLRVHIIAPGFAPENSVFNIEVEGRGSLKIPEKPLPLKAKGEMDAIELTSLLLENGDTFWVSLAPIGTGKRNVQIFIEDENGVILSGRNVLIDVSRELTGMFKKLTGSGSIIGSILGPVVKFLFFW